MRNRQKAERLGNSVSLHWRLPQNSHKDRKHLALAPILPPRPELADLWKDLDCSGDNLLFPQQAGLAPELSNFVSLSRSFREFASISITKVVNLGANHTICQN